MQNRQLIVNADGYGLTPGANRGIEECIRFGTVRSISVNVNFIHAEDVSSLVARHPWLSVGCHLNPVVGRPVLPADRVGSLINEDGEFWYREFDRRLTLGHIRLPELRAELFAQVERCRDLAGRNFSHVDCHMAKQRLPRFYPLFLEASQHAGVRRVRTFKYFLVGPSHSRLAESARYYARHPQRLGAQAWYAWLRVRARRAGFSMPDWRVDVVGPGPKGPLDPPLWTRLLSKVPPGISEFVVHPAYLDEGLRRLSGYVSQREVERKILLSQPFREALYANVRLASYHDIPTDAPLWGNS